MNRAILIQCALIKMETDHTLFLLVGYYITVYVLESQKGI